MLARKDEVTMARGVPRLSTQYVFHAEYFFALGQEHSVWFYLMSAWFYEDEDEKEYEFPEGERQLEIDYVDERKAA